MHNEGKGVGNHGAGSFAGLHLILQLKAGLLLMDPKQESARSDLPVGRLTSHLDSDSILPSLWSRE